MVRNAILNALAVAALLAAGTSCKKKYDNPITKDTQQPDKVLFDKAMNDVEHGRFEVARLTLNTLMNTYDTSEYMAKSKLLVADSWFREGGAHGLAQAEAEYKDFILFYPAMEEAAEAQEKVCKIHYQQKICKMQYDQMEKADRDPVHEIRAEEECRAVLLNFPNSKFAPEAQQLLRKIQENMAQGEYKVGKFYYTTGSWAPAANRMQTLVDQYPNFSQADDSLWYTAEAYNHMGNQWRQQQIRELSKLVREYPLSDRVDAAKQRLQELEAPAPEADPVSLAKMQYELENRETISFLSKFWGAFSMHPNLKMAAKSGTPSMEGFRPTIPATVPRTAAGTLGTSGDVTISTPADASALENNPDARTAAPGQGAAAGTTAPANVASPAPDAAGIGAAAQSDSGQQSNAQPQSNSNGKKKQAKPAKPSKKERQQPATAPGGTDASPKQ